MRLLLLLLPCFALALAPFEAEARRGHHSTDSSDTTAKRDKRGKKKRKKKKNKVPKAFRKGAKRFTFSAGTVGSFGNRYIIAGGGLSYFIANGLELGLEAEYWIGGEPSVFKLSPQIRYVVYQVKVAQPYFGAFYRRIFIGDNPDGSKNEDQGSIGGRGGIAYRAARGMYMNLGVVYEQKLDCTPTKDVPCEDIYPEVGVSMSF